MEIYKFLEVNKMICIPSNLQIENIITRINNEDMNLQPNFQRGEVWSKNKQQKLIDSVFQTQLYS